MKYISTRDNTKEYNFEQVFIKGLADDGGLYVPKTLKKFSAEELIKLKNLNYNALSAEIRDCVSVASAAYRAFVSLTIAFALTASNN